jgi:hypothetical protein
VALVYDRGEIAVLMGPASPGNTRAQFSTTIEAMDATTRLSQVGNGPALVIQPHTDFQRANPAWVAFDVNGAAINVVSATEPPSTLLRVARSLFANACATCARAARRPRASERGQSKAWGAVIGVVRLVARRSSGETNSRFAPGVVKVSTASGRTVASDFLHGWGHQFRFQLPAGRYTLTLGHCGSANVRISAHRASHAVIDTKCLAWWELKA